MNSTSPPAKTLAERAAEKFPTLQEILSEFVREIDTMELISRIRKFRDLDFKRMSLHDIEIELHSVMKFGSPESDLRPSSLCIGRDIPTGTQFYRVRPIEQSKANVPLADMQEEVDAWEAPVQRARAQRLNQAGEPMLYTSFDPSIAIQELGIAPDQTFALIIYDSVQPLMITAIGILPWSLWDIGLTNDERVKLEILIDFLHTEFTREVGDKTEHLYKVSEVLARKYFTIPSDLHDGWQYPSAARKGGINVCFKPSQVRSKLVLRGVAVSSLVVRDGCYMLDVKAVAQGFDEHGKFIYHSPETEAFNDVLSQFQKAS